MGGDRGKRASGTISDTLQLRSYGPDHAASLPALIVGSDRAGSPRSSGEKLHRIEIVEDLIALLVGSDPARIGRF